MKCKEIDCDKPVIARGWCEKHYTKWQMQEYRKKHPDFVEKSNYKTKLYMREIRKDPVIRQKHLDRCREWGINLKYEVLAHYSGEQPKCIKCGFSDIRALCIDHIYNDGAKERKEIKPHNKHRGIGSKTFYSWIRKNNFPPRYQVLCANCNAIKQRELESNG